MSKIAAIDSHETDWRSATRELRIAYLVAHVTKVLGNLVTFAGVLGANAYCKVTNSAHRLKFVMRFV